MKVIDVNKNGKDVSYVSPEMETVTIIVSNPLLDESDLGEQGEEGGQICPWDRG